MCWGGGIEGIRVGMGALYCRLNELSTLQSKRAIEALRVDIDIQYYTLIEHYTIVWTSASV